MMIVSTSFFTCLFSGIYLPLATILSVHRLGRQSQTHSIYFSDLICTMTLCTAGQDAQCKLKNLLPPMLSFNWLPCLIVTWFCGLISRHDILLLSCTAVPCCSNLSHKPQTQTRTHSALKSLECFLDLPVCPMQSSNWTVQIRRGKRRKRRD